MGFWVRPGQYQMHDPITHTTQFLFLPQIHDLAPAEVEEMVGMGEVRFREERLGRGEHKEMPKSQQHEFGPHLKSIEATKRLVRATGHGRYW